jgi:general nucleoside transport system ATP-binding protein
VPDSLALQLEGVTKRFGSLVANDKIDLELRRGEIHALLGENGAGKSTLMNVLYGLHKPDEGRMLLDGEEVHIDSPSEAIGMGIGMVHQHFMLIPVMTVAENIVLASEPTKGAFLDVRGAEQRVRELSERYGLNVNPSSRVEDITVGQQQRVEILRVLHRGAKVLILDEPTAVLTAQETAELVKVLRALKADGTSIIFISHKLREVLEVADRVTVLRRGKKIETVETKGATEASLAKLMVGRDVLFRLDKEPAKPVEPVIEVQDLMVEDDRGLLAVNGLSMQVRGGEIVGLAGVDGNGQSELIEALTGLRRPLSGTIRLGGHEMSGADVREAAAQSGHIAEDRHRRGLILAFTLAENLALRDYRKPPLSNRFGWLSPRRMRERARPMLKEYDVRGGEPDTFASSLSGGNQQKVVIAREIGEHTPALVAAQPTRGLDVGAIEFVHHQLLEQRTQGHGVLLISLELEEIRALADRVLVIYDGQIVAELSPDATEEEIGIAMTGGTRAAA